MQGQASISATQSVRKHRLRDANHAVRGVLACSRTLIPSETIASKNPDVLDLDDHVQLAQAVEATGFDFALIADGYAPASAENSRIGFRIHRPMR